MKKFEDFSDEAQAVLMGVVVVALFGGLFGIEYAVCTHADRVADRAKIKKDYNSLEVLKYNADTIEFVFHNHDVARQFRNEWKSHNYGRTIQQMPVADKMRVLKYNGDTIQIKFDDAKFQRQFEKQWRKYSDHKLNHINQNIKKR